MPSRRRSRESALQMVYQWSVGGDSPEKVVADFYGGLAGSGPVDEDPFAVSLFRRTCDEAEALDAIIKRHAVRWSLGRIAEVVRQLLRLALAELRTGQTPPEVVIDEALEIGRRYAGDECTSFVNGILEAARKELAGDGQA